MSYVNNVHASQWIEENMPENGLFRVYWSETGPGCGNSVPSFEDTGLPVRYEFMCKDGKRADGVSTGWWPNGLLKNQYTWKNGKYHGPFIDWHSYKGGVKKEERNYKDGKRDGLTTFWYGNGQKKAEINYTDDLINGKLKRWYQDGSIMYETEFENGSGVDKAYYENERIKHREIYTDGKREGLWTEWYENGQKKSEAIYKLKILDNNPDTFDGYLQGLNTFWYENGEKEREDTFKDGKKDGISQAWNKNGVLLYKIFYNNGELNKKDIRTFPHEGDPDYVLFVNVQECIKEKDSIIKKLNKSFYKELIGIDNASKK